MSGGVKRAGYGHIRPEIVKEVADYHGKFGIGGGFRFRIKNISEGVAFGSYPLIAYLQERMHRKRICPRSFMGKGNGRSWSYSTRVLRL